MADELEEFRTAVARAIADPRRLAAVRATGLLDTAPEPSFDSLTAAAASLLHTELAFLTIVDDQRSFWKSSVGVERAEPPVRQDPVDESFCQYVIGLDQAFCVRDARVDPRTRGNRAVEDMGVVAWAGEPIRSKEGDVIGSFCVMADQPRDWSATDLEILNALAGSASREVQLWTQVLESDALRRRAEALATLTARLAGDITTDEAVAIVVDAAPAVFSADLVIVGLIDPSGQHVRVVGPRSLPEEVASPFQVLSPEDRSPLTDAIRTGRLVVVDEDHARLAYPHLEDARDAASVKTSAAAPLRLSTGAIIGAIGVAWNAPAELGPVARSVLLAIASMCAQTIERTWLNDSSKDLITALTLQLFPTVPGVADLAIAAAYRPSDDRLAFGGDWYDVIALDDRRVLVIVGDVVGHGVAAAATMTQIRVVLNTLAQQGCSIEDMVPAAERLLVGSDVRYLATLALIEVDASRELVTHVSAGHPPLLLREPDSTVVRLEGGRRPPLGLGGDVRPVTAPFPPGATIVAYTDGLVERRDVPIDVGIDALAQKLRTGDADVSRLCAEINDVVEARAHRDDDIALVVIGHRQADRP